jgi:hypothetical protein
MTDFVGPFRKSSHSFQEDACVEVAATTTHARAVRDSKQTDGPLLIVSRGTWQDFLQQF